ncbi:MAG TPA: helix-turn-helix transcriptional regulator [Conexibacter sp.]|jgi:DNA-binding CsgD family transcriptional regulator
MAFDTRAAVARSALRRLTDAALDPQELLHEASLKIQRVVPYDTAGWMTLDPETLLPTGNVRMGKSSSLVDSFWRNELLSDDLHKFTDLARRPIPVAAMSAADTTESARWQEILVPAGLGDEARVVFRSGGATWGAACIHRDGDSADFDVEERAFLANVASELGRGLQLSLARRPELDASIPAPGVVLLDGDLRIVSATAEARKLITLFPGDPGITVFGVAARAKRSGSGSRARVRLRDGRWLLLHAARLLGGSWSRPEVERVAVTFDPAPRSDVTWLRLRLHGLSTRERCVAELLLTGLPTDALARQLHISRHTLRDHTKAIFAKVGASSRSELTAMLNDDLAGLHLPTSTHTLRV